MPIWSWTVTSFLGRTLRPKWARIQTVGCPACLLTPLLPNWVLKKIFFKVFLKIFGCTGSSLLLMGFLQLGQAGLLSSCWCAGFSLWWFLLWSLGSRHAGSEVVTWAQLLQLLGSRAQAQYLWHMGFIALVRSSWTRDRTHIFHIGMWSLNHWITRKPF